MKAVLLFSGQGAQSVGMGQDLIEHDPGARELLERANEALGFDLGQIMFEGPLEELTRTSRCQPALYLHGLLMLDQVRKRIPGLEPVAAAGLSLGEFTAHAAAGTFSFEDGLRVVARRGAFMEEACAAEKGTMAAMIGGEEDAIRALAEECGVQVANLNAPGQIVLSGSEAGITRAVEEAGAREICAAKPLTVAGAYHSRLMQSAQEKLSDELAGVTIAPPQFPIYSNFLADPVSNQEEIRSSLVSQVTGSVRWSESMQKIVAAGSGNERLLELGPGKVLMGLMRRIDRGTRVLPLDSLESLDRLSN